MRVYKYLFLLLFCLTSAFAQETKKPQGTFQTPELKLDRYFKGYQGAFVILDLNTGRIQKYNSDQCKERLSPCSTFKIANTLCALENKIVNSPNEILKWDGNKYSNEAWNKDLTLHQAISVSAVPHFQDIAKKIGKKRMKDFLNKRNYGNSDISGGISKFWLGSTLKISANKQVQFIKQILTNALPVSQNSIKIVKTIIKLEETEKGFLYGKTGSQGGSILGWFVGFVETSNNTFIFATNIKNGKGANGFKAKDITKEILKNLKLL